MLGIVVHRHLSWVGLMVVSLRKLAWCLLGLWKAFREEAFRSVSDQTLAEVYGVFSSRDLLYTSGGLAVDCNILGVSSTSLTNISEEGFSWLVL